MKRVGALAGALVALGSARAEAATCSVISVVPVAFGQYSATSAAPLDTVGSFTYGCSLFGVLDVITIDLSTGSSSSYFPRTMLSNGHPLAYNLYRDAARTVVWGNGAGGTSRYGPVTLTLLPVTVSIYGRIPALQNAWVGSYSDTVTITMNF